MTQHPDPATLEKTAKRLERGATELERVQRVVQAAMNRTDWQGIAGESLREEILAVQKQVNDARRDLHHMASELRHGADAMRHRPANQESHNGSIHEPDERRERLVARIEPLTTVWRGERIVGPGAAGLIGQPIPEQPTQQGTSR